MRFSSLLFLVFLPYLFVAQEPFHSPDETIDLAKIAVNSAVPGSTFSVEFVTDHTIAICRHLKTASCELSFLEWEAQGAQKLGSAVADKQQVILRAGPDHLLTTSFTDPISEMYSLKSGSGEAIPKLSPYLVSASGRTAGVSSDKNWTLYRLVPAVKKLREGSGVLLSVSDSKLAIREGDTIRIEALEGQQIGSFKARPVTRCWTDVTLLTDVLYLRTCGHQSIADWNGKGLRKVNRPEGNATRVQANESGSRLLLDHSTRHVSMAQSAGEIAQTIASLGVGAPDEFDNGEAIRVLDVNTGDVCFEFSARLPREVNASFSHASLSPSGRLLAIVQGSTLSIYRLPEKCSP